MYLQVHEKAKNSIDHRISWLLRLTVLSERKTEKRNSQLEHGQPMEQTRCLLFYSFVVASIWCGCFVLGSCFGLFLGYLSSLAIILLMKTKLVALL